MRPMTRKVRFLVWLSQFFPFHVMHVEAGRIQNYITDSLYLFGKEVWVEKDLSNATKIFSGE